MRKANGKRWLTGMVGWILCSAVMFPALLLGSDTPCGGLTSDDVKAIKETIEAYRTSWLQGNANGVLKTFVEDAVLLPHHGDSPIQGIAAIREHWFAPGGPATTITDLKITVEQVSGDGSMAFVRGQDAVSWTIAQDGRAARFSNSGTYLNVMKKLSDGSWRILAHMWDDPANRAE